MAVYVEPSNVAAGVKPISDADDAQQTVRDFRSRAAAEIDRLNHALNNANERRAAAQHDVVNLTTAIEALQNAITGVDGTPAPDSVPLAHG